MASVRQYDDEGEDDVDAREEKYQNQSKLKRKEIADGHHCVFVP